MATGIVLASNASATGSWFFWPGGRGEFRVEGTFPGTVKLEHHADRGRRRHLRARRWRDPLQHCHGDRGLRDGIAYP